MESTTARHVIWVEDAIAQTGWMLLHAYRTTKVNEAEARHRAKVLASGGWWTRVKLAVNAEPDVFGAYACPTKPEVFEKGV